RKSASYKRSQCSMIDVSDNSRLPTLIHDPSGHQVEFKYKKHANRTDRPSGKKELVVFAQTLGDAPTRIAVKFATRYHSDAHRLLAKENLAPELLYDGVISDKTTIVRFHYVLPKMSKSKLLHAQDIVFGDLRKPNVMLTRDATGRVIGAKLIDFEWCGKHLKERYPSSMNKPIMWASGVGPRALLDKAHGTEKLYKLGLRRVESRG
ncbi:hypothetical protein RSAG8_13901, partial [Rhizoctonia solani AG-8 WAC10335]